MESAGENYFPIIFHYLRSKMLFILKFPCERSTLNTKRDETKAGPINITRRTLENKSIQIESAKPENDPNKNRKIKSRSEIVVIQNKLRR